MNDTKATFSFTFTESEIEALRAAIGITEVFADVTHSAWPSVVAKIGRLPDDTDDDGPRAGRTFERE